MPVVVNDGEYTAVSQNFIREYMPSANGEFVKVYLYALSHTGTEITNGNIAGKLGILESDVCKAWDFLREEGIVEVSGDAIKFLSVSHRVEKKEAQVSRGQRPTLREVKELLNVDPNLAELNRYMQEYYGRALSAGEMSRLQYIYTDIGFPVAEIMFLVQYCAQKKHTNMSYIEKVALDWKERGLVNEDLAEAYVQSLEEKEKLYGRVKSILGIRTERPLSASEKGYVDKWCRELCFSEGVLALAYDQTIINTGTLKWAYMDKILVNWHKKGLLSEDAVKEELEGRVRKNKFNNFTQESLNMSDIEMAVIQKRLKEQGAIK